MESNDNDADEYDSRRRMASMFGFPVDNDLKVKQDLDVTANELRQNQEADVLSHFHLPQQDLAYSRFQDATISIAQTLLSRRDVGNHLEGMKMVDAVKQKLPQKNPSGGHRTIFVTVQEACSGNAEDVGRFIMHLKNKLKVGTPDGPPRLVLAGDQQVRKAFPSAGN